MEKERQDLYIWQGLYRCIARLIWAGHDDQTPVCQTWYYRRSGDEKPELLSSGETEAPFTSWVIQLKGQHKVYGSMLCLCVLTMQSTLWKKYMRYNSQDNSAWKQLIDVINMMSSFTQRKWCMKPDPECSQRHVFNARCKRMCFSDPLSGVNRPKFANSPITFVHSW